MSARLDDSAYLENIREMVLVDIAPNDQFAVVLYGDMYAVFDDVLDACDYAEKMAARNGRKWDVTVQARNAGDME